MPATLTFSEYGEAIGTAGTVIRAQAGSASPESPVPTCPGWTLRDLIAHVGGVYAWASAIVSGADLEAAGRAAAAVQAAGMAVEALPDWFDDQLVLVLNTIASSPADREYFFFLKDAPDKRLAWARRQAHETSIHAVDAMSAKLGQVPAVAQTWLRPAFASDGIDELVMGFLPRSSSQLRSTEPLTLRIDCTDTGAAWTITVGPDAPVSIAHGADALDVAGARPDAILSGPAVAVYLAVWNRSSEVRWSGPYADRAADLWASGSAIAWG